MRRSRTDTPQPVHEIIDQVLGCGEDAMGMPDRLRLLADARHRLDGQSHHLDAALLEQALKAREALHTAGSAIEELKSIVNKLTSPPWHLAVFIQHTETHAGKKALVCIGSRPRLVDVAAEIAPQSLKCGMRCFLNNEQNLVLAAEDQVASDSGALAVFERRLPNDRLVIRHQNEERIVKRAFSLRDTVLQSGDLVRYSPDAELAMERIERNEDQWFLVDSPRDTFLQIGGLDREIETIRNAILLIRQSELVAKYRLTPTKSILFKGPPGTGKTMLARATANFLGTLSPAGRSHFVHVAPSACNSMWFGQSEANYRELFRAARDRAARNPDTPVILFFDEIDSIGRSRDGGATRQHAIDDRVLAAFLAELDGLEPRRGNVLVMAATNRIEVLDPALLRPGRLGDCQIQIGRPSRESACAIFEKHLPADVPFCPDHARDDCPPTQQGFIQSAASHIFAPNSPINELAVLTFRDGRQRSISPRDLVSGAMIANCCRIALDRACRREMESAQAGLRMTDLLDAITDQFETTTSQLTHSNVGSYIADLPQDLPPPVKVEPTKSKQKMRRSYRYVSAA
jgi:proteasome-associated ATPase